MTHAGFHALPWDRRRLMMRRTQPQARLLAARRGRIRHDSFMTENPAALTPRRLRKGSFRLGLLRDTVYKPMATVGISRDGGIFVAPADVANLGWTYGLIRPSGPIEGDTVTTQVRPKLHYHRSGIAAITLTGPTELERRTLRLSPLSTVTAEQVLSLVAVRPWELETAKSLRKGDVFTRVRRWPTSVAFSLSVMVASDDQQQALILPELSPMGLLPLDARTDFVVSLNAYGHQALLVGGAHVQYDEDRYATPGIAVTALPRILDGQVGDADNLGLWSTSLRNPITLREDSLPISLTPTQGVLHRRTART